MSPGAPPLVNPDFTIFISKIFLTPLEWFSTLLTKTNSLSLWLSFLGMVMIYRFLLKPLFGSAGSDKVNKPRNGGNSNG